MQEWGGFGTMSFQMVLLPAFHHAISADGFGTMSFQMVLLQIRDAVNSTLVLELCHSRWLHYRFKCIVFI